MRAVLRILDWSIGFTLGLVERAHRRVLLRRFKFVERRLFRRRHAGWDEESALALELGALTTKLEELDS